MFKVHEDLSGLLKAMPAHILFLCLLQEHYSDGLSTALNKIMCLSSVFNFKGLGYSCFLPSFFSSLKKLLFQ